MDNTARFQRLSGLAVAIVAGNGFEQAELVEPRRALDELGVTTCVVAVNRGRIQGYQHERAGDLFEVDLVLADAHPDAFDGVLVPGGVRHADMIRASREAQQFIREMDRHNNPLAVICHGPWLLISAGIVRGRSLTSWPALQADIVNAGGHWRDEPVVVDRNWVSSRNPADLAQLIEKFIGLLSVRLHAATTRG